MTPRQPAHRPGSLCLLFVAALAFWVAVLRYPYAGAVAFDGDEALYLLIGQKWLHGIWPYTDIWDVKPPGLFLIFAAAQRAFGETLVAPRLASAAAVLTTALGLFTIARRHFGSPRAGMAAAFLYPPYTLLMGGLASKAELFAAPFVVWACHALLASQGGHRPAARLLALSGVLFGCALLVKQTAAFEALFTFGFVAWGACRTRRPLPVLVFAAGASAPSLVVAASFAWSGHLGALAEAAVIAAAGRLSGDGVAIPAAGLRFLAQLKPMLPLLGAAALLLAERRALRAAADYPALRFLAGWTVASAAGVLAMRATYDSYLLPLLPPFALAAGRFADHLAAPVDGGRRRQAAALGLLAAALVYPFAFLHGTIYPALAASRLPAEVAEFLRDRGVTAGDSLYVVDQEPVIYFLSGAALPTRYPLPQHLLCAFPDVGFQPEAEIRRIMETRPHCVVVSESRSRAVCQQPRRMAIIEPYLRRDYRLERRFNSPLESADVFCRHD